MSYMLSKGRKSSIQGLKIIFRYLGEYKKELIIISALGLISAISNSLIPYLTGRLFDAILIPAMIFTGTKLAMPLWFFLIVIWLITMLISNVAGWEINRKSDWLGEDIYNNYITKSANYLLELPVSFHKDHNIGEIQQKINRAADALQIISRNIIINLTPQFLSIFIALTFSFYINYLLAGIMLLGITVYSLILIKMVPLSFHYHREVNKAYSKAFGNIHSAILNIQPIKQAVAEKYEQNKIFKDFRIKVMGWYKKINSFWSGLSFSQNLIVSFTQFMIFIISIFFIHKGSMTIGELIMFNGYSLMLFSPFAALGRNWRFIQNGIVTVEQSEKILSLPTEKYIPENITILSDIQGKIEFQDVSFAYKSKQPVLDDVSFKIIAGEITAIVGESGVGKSTLIDLISGYYFPQKGKVLIDGHSTKNLDLQFLRSRIAVVPQEVILFNDTIKTNITYGNFGASFEKIKAAADQAHCLDFIEKFPKKWNQIVGERGVKLSVGQKQRVAIARAILKNPKILILDEPTSALDAKSEKLISESLEKLMQGRTTIIIAHRLSTIRKVDKILVLDNGKIVEEGNHESLIKIPNGVYRKLYELQIGFK